MGFIASAPGAIPAAYPPGRELRCARLLGGQDGRGEVFSWYSALSQSHCQRNWAGTQWFEGYGCSSGALQQGVREARPVVCSQWLYKKVCHYYTL